MCTPTRWTLRHTQRFFPGAQRSSDKVTFKVCLALQRDVQGGMEFWLSQDRQCRHFPVASLDHTKLWGKTRPQQEAVARGGIQEILRIVCRGIRAHVLEALVSQTRFAVVSNASRRDGHYVYFAGWVRTTRDELPSDMTWRWLDAAVIWDMVQENDLNLTVSAAEVVKTMFSKWPAPVQRQDEGESRGRSDRQDREYEVTERRSRHVPTDTSKSGRERGYSERAERSARAGAGRSRWDERPQGCGKAITGGEASQGSAAEPWRKEKAREAGPACEAHGETRGEKTNLEKFRDELLDMLGRDGDATGVEPDPSIEEQGIPGSERADGGSREERQDGNGAEMTKETEQAEGGAAVPQTVFGTIGLVPEHSEQVEQERAEHGQEQGTGSSGEQGTRWGGKESIPGQTKFEKDLYILEPASFVQKRLEEEARAAAGSTGEDVAAQTETPLATY